MKKMHTILLLGSGALKIGEAGEFDYSGTQAIKALKEQGKRVILVNPNVATIQTSEGLADELYFLPVTPEYVEKVIVKEKPDGVLLSFGGQTALNCGLSLHRLGVFKKYGVQTLGTPISAIEATEDRKIFTKRLKAIGLKTAKGKIITSIHNGIAYAKSIGFPVMVRAGFALGGTGSGIAKTKEELRIFLTNALAVTPQVVVEECLSGWKELEYEVVRDVKNNCITVCNMENFDPVGIHTGESIVVAPSQTLTNHEYFMLRQAAIDAIREFKIVGECNIQYALNPKTDEFRVIEVNARLSRSSALASKATGYPLAYIAAKLALGITLPELKNKVTKKTTAFFEPALDYVVVKIPRWDLDKFTHVSQVIGSEMKSVGEVMSIGRTFEEAVQKASRMMVGGQRGVMDLAIKGTKKILEKQLQDPDPYRLFTVCAALRVGVSMRRIYQITGIDYWFLAKLANIVKTYHELAFSSKTISPQLLKTAKELGFSDNQIGGIVGKTEDVVRTLRKSLGIVPYIKHIDTTSGEFPAQTNYLYLTYNASAHDHIPLKSTKKAIVLGCGPYAIGTSVEFDWCAVNTVMTLKKEGWTSVTINCNPETVSTDYDISDFLYFDELSFERVMDIYDYERAPLIVSVGGQIPNNLVPRLAAKHVPMLGTRAKNITMAEDRKFFSNLMDSIGIKQPEWREVTTAHNADMFAGKVGYPILVRPSFVLSGKAMSVIESKDLLYEYIKQINFNRKNHSLVMTKFLAGAAECDVDGVARNGILMLSAISEHVESGGVHSGDSTLIQPPQTITEADQRIIMKKTAKIVKSLHITGPFNVQFLIFDGEFYVIECNVRASRSIPFVSKALGVNFIERATKILIGTPITVEPAKHLPYVSVKVPQFSFHKLRGSDPILTVEMNSTGEVAGFGKDTYEAYLKGIMATGINYPTKQAVFLALGGSDGKLRFLQSAKKLHHAGFTLYVTTGTGLFLREHEIPAVTVGKIYEGTHPNILDLMQGKMIDLAVVLPEHGNETKRGRLAKSKSDGYIMRRMAVDMGITIFTQYQTAELFVESMLRYSPKTVEIASWRTYIETPIKVKEEHMIRNKLFQKDILSVDQFSLADIGLIMQTAKKMKKIVVTRGSTDVLKGKIMTALFYEPSSRTFASFITAIQRLGGGFIPLQGVTYSSVSKGETLSDTVQTFAGYSDIVVIRHPEMGSAKIAAEFSTKPVINAGDGVGEHPTQALLDLFTILDHFGSAEGITITMVGDLLNGRTVHSLSKLLLLYKNITFHFVSPEQLRLPSELVRKFREKNIQITQTEKLDNVLAKTDVLYVTRVQKERFTDLETYEQLKHRYVITTDLVRSMKQTAIIMHPFPRVGEIDPDVDLDKRAVYIKEEMPNGMYVRMALLQLILIQQ